MTEKDLTPGQKEAAVIIVREYRYNLILLYLKSFMLFCLLSLGNILVCSLFLPTYKPGIQFTEGLTILLMIISGIKQANDLTDEFRSELCVIFDNKSL